MAWHESPMFLAARDSDIELMKHLVEQGVSVDISDDFTLLHCAAIWGSFEVAEYLVFNNCEINRKTIGGKTAVLMAAEKQWKNIVKLLVQSGADLGGYASFYKWTLLHFASYFGWRKIVQIILEKEAVDVNVKSSVMETPLLLAIEWGNERIAELLIGAGADLSGCDAKKKNILHYACSTFYYSVQGLAKTVKCIVERGETDLNAKSIHNFTPLHYAVDTNKEDIAEILIQAGANTNLDPFPPTGLSIFHHCIKIPAWTKLVRMIVQKGGCDLNPASGPIPLHLACQSQYQNIETIKLLISAGADINFKNDRNEMALFYPINFGDFLLIRLLVQHGAYFGAEECHQLSLNFQLKELLIEDAQLCIQSLINKFNNALLPAVYNVPVFHEALPHINTVTINSDESTAMQEITNFVNSQIRKKSISNVLNGCPIVLKLICVEWLIKYWATL